MLIDEGDAVSEEAAHALIAEARRHVRPLDLAARRLPEGGFAADLLMDDGRVAQRVYGSGPNQLLAILAAEQRYLAEQEGGGTVRGATYLEKARERVRRGRLLWSDCCALSATCLARVGTVSAAKKKGILAWSVPEVFPRSGQERPR